MGATCATFLAESILQDCCGSVIVDEDAYIGLKHNLILERTKPIDSDGLIGHSSHSALNEIIDSNDQDSVCVDHFNWFMVSCASKIDICLAEISEI